MQSSRAPDLREYIPVLRLPRQKLVLPIWNHGEFLPFYVDDTGTCAGQHVMTYGKQHRYQSEGGALYTLLCPERLTWDQKQSLIEDIPEGSWAVKVAGRKIDKIAQDAEKRRKAIEEERMQGPRR